MTQEASVLIRVPGAARDRLLKLRQKSGAYAWSGLESLGSVISRLAAAAKVVNPSVDAGDAGKRSKRPQVNNKISTRKMSTRHRRRASG